MVECASVLAGPAVGAFFAELGADVIKVENPKTGGDVTRGWLGNDEECSDGRSAYFCSVNAGKKSLSIDLSSAPEALFSLLSDADLYLHNFKLGAAARLGLDDHKLLQQFPKLIIGRINGFGSESPRVGYDALIQAECGLMHLNAELGQPGHKMPVALMDQMAAHQLKEGLLLALMKRGSKPQDRLVEVSLWGAALSALANQACNWTIAGVEPQPMGSEHPNIFPYGCVFDCLDQERVILVVGSDRQFTALAELLGRQDWLVEFQKNTDRVQGRDRLRQELSGELGKRRAQDWLEEFHRLEIPAGRVQTVSQALQLDAKCGEIVPQIAFRALGGEVARWHTEDVPPWASHK